MSAFVLISLIVVLLIGFILGVKFHAAFVEDAKLLLADAKQFKLEGERLFAKVQNSQNFSAKVQTKAPPK